MQARNIHVKIHLNFFSNPGPWIVHRGSINTKSESINSPIWQEIYCLFLLDMISPLMMIRKTTLTHRLPVSLAPLQEQSFPTNCDDLDIIFGK